MPVTAVITPGSLLARTATHYNNAAGAIPHELPRTAQGLHAPRTQQSLHLPPYAHANHTRSPPSKATAAHPPPETTPRAPAPNTMPACRGATSKWLALTPPRVRAERPRPTVIRAEAVPAWSPTSGDTASSRQAAGPSMPACMHPCSRRLMCAMGIPGGRAAWEGGDGCRTAPAALCTPAQPSAQWLSRTPSSLPKPRKGGTHNPTRGWPCTPFYTYTTRTCQLQSHARAANAPAARNEAVGNHTRTQAHAALHASVPRSAVTKCRRVREWVVVVCQPGNACASGR